MGNCLRNIDEEGGVILDLAGIDKNLRPEEVPVKDWCFLSNVYKHSTFYKKDRTSNIVEPRNKTYQE